MKVNDNAGLIQKWATQLHGDYTNKDFSQFMKGSDEARTLTVATIFESQFKDIEENPTYYEKNHQDELRASTTAKALLAHRNLFENAKEKGLSHLITEEHIEQVSNLAVTSNVQIVDYEKFLREGLEPEITEDGKKDYGKYLTEGVIAGDHGYNADNIAGGIASGNFVNTGPAMLGIIKRVLPHLVGFDLCGVQATSVPHQQILVLRAMEGKYGLESTKELFHPEQGPNAQFSGFGAGIQQKFDELKENVELKLEDVYLLNGAIKDGATEKEIEADKGFKWLKNNGEYGYRYVQAVVEGLKVEFTGDIDNVYAWVKDNITKGNIVFTSSAMATRIAELQEGFNESTDNAWQEVSFRIDKVTAEVKERRLKAQSSLTAITDARTTLGIDVMSLLNTIIVDEMKQEINREIIEWVNASAVIGKSGRSNTDGTNAGTFDIMAFGDVKGGMDLGQRAKTLNYQLTKESVEINRKTGRGMGNVSIASPNVVNLLSQTTGAYRNSFEFGLGGTALNPDTSVTTNAGTILNRIKLLNDQFAHTDYITTGFVGSNPLDCGIVYSPYVMFAPYQAQNPDTFTPIIGYLSRYAISINPFAEARTNKPSGRNVTGMPSAKTMRRNDYYRYMEVKGL